MGGHGRHRRTDTDPIRTDTDPIRTDTDPVRTDTDPIRAHTRPIWTLISANIFTYFGKWRNVKQMCFFLQQGVS